MINTKIDTNEAFQIYEQMGRGRTMRKLEKMTNISLSVLGKWSSEGKWQERLKDSPAEQDGRESDLDELKKEQAALRVKLDEQREQLTTLQLNFATKLSEQRNTNVSRASLVEASRVAQKAVTAAQSELAQHLNMPDEPLYSDKLYKVTQVHKSACADLAAFDQQHESESVAVMQDTRVTIHDLEKSVEQLSEQLRTLSAEIDDRMTRDALQHILTAYQELYHVMAKDGPMLDLVRKYTPTFYYHLYSHLTILPDDVVAFIDPGPVLAERQATINKYLALLASDQPLE